MVNGENSLCQRNISRDTLRELRTENMLKNVKIDSETHRLLSMKAAEIPEQKGILCAVLIRAALEKFTDEELKMMLSDFVTSHEISD